MEEKLIDAEYKIWKKNTPYLYDFVLTHSLDWPSLTCQWLPTVKKSSQKPSNTAKKSAGTDQQRQQHLQVSEHSLLIGTHTNGEQNYLMVASIGLPQEDTEIIPSASATTQSKAGVATTNVSLKYDEEKREIGGFGAPSEIGKIDTTMKLYHDGEVNRARYMPQNHFIVASRGPQPPLYIFDLSKHPSKPSPDSGFCPQATCMGHDAEGYGIVWSPHQMGRLLSASDDCTVKLWDVEHVVAAGAKVSCNTTISPLATLAGHTKPVQDVDWHPHDANLVISAGDDAALRLWDLRAPLSRAVASNAFVTTALKENTAAHTKDINSVKFNPNHEYVYASGSSDHTVC
jgi:WD40 repeat protein